jgi:glycine cleavage system H lipoate-binding protein
MVALLVLLLVLVSLTIDYAIQRRRGFATAGEAAPSPVPVPVLHNPEYRTPPGVYFGPGHMWAFLEESGDVRVGADDLARVVVGEVESVDTPAPGTKVRAGEPLIQLRHGERAVSLQSPVDGVVEAINTKPTTADDAFTAGWIVRIRPEDTSVLQRGMLLGTRAKDWLDREVHRLRVFLSTVAQDHPVLAATMQDGGLPYAGLVEYLNDVEWNKLQETFFRGETGARS